MSTDSNVSVRSDDRALSELLTRYFKALNTSDPELAVSCYTADGMLMAQALATSTGSELVSSYHGFFAARDYDITFEIDELVVVSDTLAYAITHTAGMLTRMEDGARSRGANREMFIFRREDGEWRIARYIFNNDTPPG